MNDVIDISWWQLLIFSGVLIVPYGINNMFKLDLGKEVAVGIIRMTLQLVFVGVYLNYLFELNSLIINIGWLMVMMGVGASSIVSKAKLPHRTLFFPVLIGLLVGLSPILLVVCLTVLQPSPLYSAQYLIPLAGMLLGNSLSGNIVALQNLFASFEDRKSEYVGAISLGASAQYATQPFIRSAMQKAWAPILASMATTGLVTLPGMMTGQILGGASPMVAIKYQLMIMIAIFVTMSVSLTIALQLTIRNAITPEGRVTVQLSHKA